MTDEQTVERFWSKVDRDSETGCWLWTAGQHSGKFGMFWDGDRPVLAHRFAWQLERGPIAEGLELDHLCRVRHCVNPAHMELVDHRAILLRGAGLAAINAAKTECAHGHPYDEANTYSHNGRRICRACNRLRVKEHRARKRAEETPR